METLSNAQAVEGGCLCGAVRYRMTGAPLSSIICHCRTCRKANAAPTVAWLTLAIANFEFLSGSPRSFQSSLGVTRKFCGACGSPLTYESSRDPDTIDVTTVSLDSATPFPPTREVWLEHKLEWEVTNPAIDPYPRGTNDESN